MGDKNWCRDCAKPIAEEHTNCPYCRSHRLFFHTEASELSIAHLDCDAFFASVEKRDNPELKSVPVLIGGDGPRSVVSTACYIARAFGAKSAMPMGKAKKLCPDAVIVRPRIKEYAKEGQILRDLMRELTPMVEPLSIDEAFMDLTGTQRLHGGPAIQHLIALQNRIENERGISVSIGLSHNKFLAKSASDLDKPRGFSVIGKAETLDVLGTKPPSFVFGVGPVFADKLNRDGFKTLAQIREVPEKEMAARYGGMGLQLCRLAKGQDSRKISPGSTRKSISTEITMDRDVAALDELQNILWRLCDKSSRLAKQKQMAGHTLTLKLKTARHEIITRSITMDQPVQLAETLYRELQTKLSAVATGKKFRLVGAGFSTLVKVEPDFEEMTADLLAPDRDKKAKAERAMDKAREKFGKNAIIKGRSLKPQSKNSSNQSKG